MVEGGLETMAVCREDAKDRRGLVSRIGLEKNIVTNYLISFKWKLTFKHNFTFLKSSISFLFALYLSNYVFKQHSIYF